MLDYHVHTSYCRHATGSVEDYVKSAIQKRLKEIGFADHFPMFYLPDLPYDDYSMTLEELPDYANEVGKARKKFLGKIDVKLGVEVDYRRGEESMLKRMLSSQEFDYTIGVIHVIDDWVIDDSRNVPKYNDYDLDEFYSRYFMEVEALIRSGLFNILGHLDVIKKFGHFPEGGVDGYVMPCLDLIVDKEICVEINTSGLDRPAKDTYPSLNLLGALYDRGIQVTLGSDAHNPKEVGRNFDYVLNALKKSGYREIVQFEKKVKKTIKI